jgi:cell wall-associated NlpC family hydrolase
VTEDEFVLRIVGTPCKRWRGDWEACDCWGMLVLAHREILGIEVGPMPHVTLADGFAAMGSHWPRCEPQPGSCAFMAWRDEVPEHCGFLLKGNRVLHAPYSAHQASTVRVTPLAVMRRLYGGEITFHRYAPSS